MDWQYNYLLTDFSNNKVDINLLTREINSKISDLNYISLDLSMCNIFFTRELTTIEEDTTLFNIISDHTGIIFPFKIYKYIQNYKPSDPFEPPYDLDYNILGFHKNREMTKGEINHIDYYSDYDPSTKVYSNLIVKEHRVYYRVNEMLDRRKMYIEWFTEDGSVGATKNDIFKYYNPQESLRAGEVRRNNIISDLKISTVGLIMMAKQIDQRSAADLGELLLAELNAEISQYKEGSEDNLSLGILDASAGVHDWLEWEIPNTGGVNIRYYLLDKISISYTDNNVYT